MYFLNLDIIFGGVASIGVAITKTRCTSERIESIRGI